MKNTEALPTAEFLGPPTAGPLFDVRTPAEYLQGHIPGALNLPLFTDEERAAIGTIYANEGREAAILRGLEYVGPRMRSLVETVSEKAGNRKTVRLYCWRGGMRSGSLAWLLDFSGYRVFVLKGGYKAYRNYIRQQFETPRNYLILGGYTGSGKTEILRHLQEFGEQVVDLEGLAHHKGSSFGSLGEEEQPAQQQFENYLGAALGKTDAKRPVWLEDESRRIGRLFLPQPLWEQMRETRILFLEMPVELRTARLLADYGRFRRSELAAGIERLEKRLGGSATRQAVDYLNAGSLPQCIRLLLTHYYDKTYRYGMSRRPRECVSRMETDTPDARENARRLQTLAHGKAKLFMG